MAFFHVPGPAHIYIRMGLPGAGPNRSVDSLFAAGQPALFLGHTELAPEPAFEPQYKPVMSTLAGEAIPDDKVSLGVATKVVLDLQRFDWPRVDLITTPARFGRAVGNIPAAPVGSESYLDRGRLVAGHGDGYELWIAFSFFGTVNAFAGLPPGYYFPCCTTAGQYPTKLTRDATKIRLMIEPLPVRAGITGGFMTWSQDPKYFTGLPLPE